jgi:cell division topological specificity factor
MMRILDYFFAKKEPSAAVARERLQIVLAHERVTSRGGVDFLPKMQRELLTVVAKYVEVQEDMIRVNLGKQGSASVLEINIEIDPARKARVAAAG